MDAAQTENMKGDGTASELVEEMLPGFAGLADRRGGGEVRLMEEHVFEADAGDCRLVAVEEGN